MTSYFAFLTRITWMKVHISTLTLFAVFCIRNTYADGVEIVEKWERILCTLSFRFSWGFLIFSFFEKCEKISLNWNKTQFLVLKNVQFFSQVFRQAASATHAMCPYSVSAPVSWARLQVLIQSQADPPRHPVPLGQPGIVQADCWPRHQIVH